MITPLADITGCRIRFDVFEADLRSGELWKEGVKVKLGEQPFAVLTMLLAQPGEVTTREELQKKLWPADTFVDFDRGLNKAINRLRDALDDSAATPRFIETLPKRGYRFIATLQQTRPAECAPNQTDTAVDAIRIERSRARSPMVLAGGAIGAFALVAITVVWWQLAANRPAQADVGPLIRSSLLPPPGMTFIPYSLALSPEGTHLAFVAEADDGSRSVWIRAMSATTGTRLPGTDGASLPFWSADLRHIGFFADGKLKVIDVAGGAIRVVADAPRASGGTWNADDVIVFAPDVNGPLYRVAAAGGRPAVVSRAPEGERLRGHRWPVFLPDGRQFLYVAFSSARTSDNALELRLGSLDTLESTRVEWDGARSAAYALDHLIYVRAGTLYAQSFDAARRRTTGSPVPIAAVELAGQPAYYPSALAVSANGVLVFQAASDLPSQVVWLDERGREQGILPAKYAGPTISPDGRFVAGSCDGPRAGTLAICVFDLERGISSRVTQGPTDRYPLWSPDGRQIAYASGAGIYRVEANRSGSPRWVSHRGIPTSWLPDGRILSFGSHQGVLSLALSAPATHEVTELGPGVEGQLSPDAAWLAYVAEDGLAVQRFPGGDTRVIVAGGGANQPRWSRNGRRLFYVTADKKLMAADFDPLSATARAAQMVGQTRIIGAARIGFQYDVAPDGRFIINALTARSAPLTLMSGWTSKLGH